MRAWLILTVLLFCPPAVAQVLQESVTEVWVHDVPGPPQGDFWDPVSEHLISAFTNPASVYPDVVVCARALTGGAPHCSRICWDLKGDSHGNGQPSTECQRPLRVRLAAGDPRMLIEVLEMDHDGEGARIHAVIARDIVASDPSRCSVDEPCRWRMPQGRNTSKGTLVLSFSTEVHGVLGTLPAPSAPWAPAAPTASGGSGTSGTGTPAWQPAWDWVKSAYRKWAQGKDPNANSYETAQRGSAATQAAINACLAAIPDELATANHDDTLRRRMPLCAGLGGKAFEGCMYTKVLFDDNIALEKGYACSRQFQDKFDTLAKTGAYVWLKSKVCGVGQWIGLRVCQG